VVFVIADRVGKEHHHVRSQAYPYDVRHLGGADGDVEQDLVVEARRKEDHGEGELLGFINVRSDNYIIDIAVAPSAQGMGLGASLIREAAKECLARSASQANAEGASEEINEHAEKTQPLIKLHVRLYNLQARTLYLKLGFKETQRCFPAWYDWHGGVSMEVSIEKLLDPSAPSVSSQMPSMTFLKPSVQKHGPGKIAPKSKSAAKAKPQGPSKETPAGKAKPLGPSKETPAGKPAQKKPKM
jgi:ribosomal protein S18 acetylase RimI-like enzyme